MFGVFYGLLANNGDFQRFDDFVAQLKVHLADGLMAVQTQFDACAAEIAKKYYASPYMMWLGEGELWGEVYLFTMCILEEMQWLRTKSAKSSEFFHGTLELVVVDIKDYWIDGIDEEFAPLVSPLLSTALLNGRLSKHFEANMGHNLDMRRYYRQFVY